MKIAIVTDDGDKISAHFGRATQYVVLTLENGQIAARELRDKATHHDLRRGGHHDQHAHSHGHGRGMGIHSAEKHRQMFANITDCQIVVARGMGQGAFNGLQQAGIEAILTDIPDVETAARAVLEGTLIHRPERLH